MSLDGSAFPQIQVENVIDYAQYISQVANLDPSLSGLQGLHGLQALPDGTTVAFIDSSVFDPSQLFDTTAIEVHQTLPDGAVDLQQCHQVVLEQPVIEQIGGQATTLEALDVKPPIGKGPFNCNHCDKVFNKWNQLQRHLKTHAEDKPYRCNQCSMSYNIENNLLLHLATHVGPDRDPICPECDKKFSRVASLKAHIMLHEKEESLMCPECGDEFSVQHQLDKHLQEHRQESEGVKIYQCQQCNQEFSKMSALKEHMKKHYKVKASLQHRNYKRNVDRTGFIHKCKTCSKTFQKPSQLERHERIHTGERPFACHLCQRTFNQKGALQMHMTKHTGARPHPCTLCPMTFAQKGNLRAHIQRVHTLSKEEHGMIYECDECSCMFRRLGSLNAHISRAHADPGDSNQSTVQDIKLPIQQHSLQHLTDMNDASIMQDVLGLDHVSGGADLVDGQVIHGSLDQGTSDILQQALENSGLQGTVEDEQEGDVKEVGGTTSVVGKTHTTNANSAAARLARLGTMAVHDSATGLLKRHYIRKVNGIRWHQCTYCTKEFKKPSDLVRHIRIHTHEKPYKCTQCFRAFAVKSTLTAHIKTHTGVKEFRCEVCNKMFSTQGSLKVHLRLHTGAKPFSCNHCDKKFRTSAHCKAHNQSHLTKDSESSPRPRRALKRASRHDSMLTDIPLQEPILITDSGLIQQPPRNSMFPPFVTESGNPERPYKCHHCRRGFKKSSHLKQHVRSHTGEKPFRCTLCLRSFVSSGVLKAHARTHSGEKSHKCLVCDAMFTTGGSLKRHMSTHSEVRPFMCPYCQKTFKTSVNCKKHMKTHRHELAMQHYQTVKEGDGAGGTTDGADGRGEDDGEIVEEDGLTGPQTLTDLDVLQEQDIGHTTTVTQPDLQVVDVNQSGGVTADTLSLDAGLQQAFGQGMFGHNFTLQPQFVQLSSQGTGQLGGQDEKNDNQSRDGVARVTVQLEGQLNSQVASSLAQPLDGQGTTQYTYQPQNWKSNLDTNVSLSTGYENQQATTIHVISDSSLGVKQSNQEDEEDEGQEMDEGTMDEDDHDPNEGQPQGMNPISHGTSSIGRRGFRCHICSKIFKRSSHLTQHMKIHSAGKSFQCPECSKSFSSSLVLQNHLRSHIGLKAHMCTQCSAAFSSAASLRRHKLQHSVQKSYVCELCSEPFKNSAQLRRHMKDCQVDPMPMQELITKPNDENQAPKRGPRRRSLGQQQLYSDEQVSISEKILMESASEKDRISMPKDVQNQTVRRGRFANMCSHCPKSFKKPSDLQRHLRIHTGEKPFTCDICNRSFTVKSTLDSHMRTHKSVEKTFLCHVCNSMFSTKGSLKVHMRLHTGAKPFKCIHCDLRFRTSGHRKSHMISHFKPTEGLAKKKTAKAPAQPLLTSTQDNNVQSPMFILAMNQQNTAQNAVANQAVSIDQTLGTQMVGVDQSLGSQVISVDQSLLQNQAMMPVQLTVNDGGAGDGTGLPTQVLQGLDGGIQLHITAPLGQLGQSFQLTGLDASLLQQAVQIDASLLQQLQQNGFITINPSGIQPTLTADLSQVGAEMVSGGVVVSTALAGTDSLIGQSIPAQDAMIGQQAVQETEVSHGAESMMGQQVVVSDALMVQTQNSEALMVHALPGGATVVSQQGVESKPLPIYTSAQVMGTHRLSDALLSQQPTRIQVSSGVTDSLIGQSVHSSQESYHTSGATRVSDAVIGQDRLMATSMSDALISRQISYSDAIMGTAGEHAMIQGMQLQSASMTDAVNPNIIVQSMSGIPGHQGVKSQGVEQGNTTFITQEGQRLTVQTVNVYPGATQDLGLVKIAEVDEEDPKFALPGEDSRMVNIGQLGENPSMGHHGNPLDDEEEEDNNNEEVDTSALIPTADVVNLERPQEGNDRQYICRICYKGFKRAAHLREHMSTHGSAPVLKKPKATPHKCNVCSKAFQKPSQVERHMRIHTGERPFSCNICGKAFNQKNALQVHLRKHSGEKPHICPYCSSSFVQSGNLKTHIKRAHHNDMVNTMNLPRGPTESSGAGEQEAVNHGVPSGLEEAQSGIGGEVNVGSVGGMEHDGMDLVEVVDLFVQ